MQHDKLAVAVVEQIRKHPELNLETLQEFVGVGRNAINRWLRDRESTPRGERLNKLLHFLAAIGIPPKEINQLSPYVRYVGELHAFGVLPLDNGKENDILYILNVGTPQSALYAMRSEHGPMSPNVPTVEALKKLYGEDLEAAKSLWSDQLSKALSSQSTSNKAKPKPSVSEDRLIVSPPKPVIEPAAPLPPEDVEAAFTSSQPTMRTAADDQEAIAAVVEGVRQVVAVNQDYMLELAKLLAQAKPLVTFALSENCNDEDRAFMREMLGHDNLFQLMRGLTKLSSTRVYNEGN